MGFFRIALLAVAHLFAGFLGKVLKSDQAKEVETTVVNFVKTDVGLLALDAVEYASTLPAGTSSSAARDAAVAKLKVDLKTAGHDVTSIATSTLNLFIEMAYTYISGTIANLPTAVK